MEVYVKIESVNGNVITISFDEYPSTLIDVELFDSDDGFDFKHRAYVKDGYEHEVSPIFTTDLFIRPIIDNFIQTLMKENK